MDNRVPVVLRCKICGKICHSQAGCTRHRHTCMEKAANRAKARELGGDIWEICETKTVTTK